MCRCGHPSAVVLPEDEVDVCDYARLVLEVLWDSIALHCDYDYDYDPHSGGGQTHKKARQSGTVDHSAEVGWMDPGFMVFKFKSRLVLLTKTCGQVRSNSTMYLHTHQNKKSSSAAYR